jgi:hypothetical protein
VKEKLTVAGGGVATGRETSEKDFTASYSAHSHNTEQMALQDHYYTMTADGRLVIFDYRQYLGEQIYRTLEKEIAGTRTILEEADLWHDAVTPARVTGMIMAAGFSVAELAAMAVDSTHLGEVTLEAIELIVEEAKKGATFPKVTKCHPEQRTPVWQTLSHASTQAVLTMRPLVAGH